MLVNNPDSRDVGGGWERVIHQRAGEQLSVSVIGDLLKQDAAQPLSGAAHNLAFDQRRVDEDAAIMGDGVVLDAYTAGLGVDIDDCDMHRIAPGDGLRLPVIGLLEAGFDLWRAFVLPARTRRLGDPGEAHRGSGNSRDAHAAPAQLKISRRTFEEIGGYREDLVAEPGTRLV